MTQLRRMMLEELQRRNYSHQTIRAYLRAVTQFAEHFGKRPDQLGPDALRTYQAYLLRERKLAVGSVVAQVAALRFFYVRTLKRREFREDLAPFLLAVPADLVVLGIGVELAAVIFPAALPLTIRATANNLLGMITGKLKQLLAAATVAIGHEAAPSRDACRPL